MIKGTTWEMDDHGVFTGPDGDMTLTGRSERLMFRLLCEQPGKTLSCDRLAAAMWGDRLDPPHTHNVVLVAWRLTRKFRAIGVDGVIGNARGYGYFLRARATIETITHTFTPGQWRAVEICVAMVAKMRPELAARTGVVW